MFSWMVYSVVVSLLMGLAALALERSAQIRRRPARWLWAMCMVASLAIPFIPSKVSVQIPGIAEAGKYFKKAHIVYGTVGINLLCRFQIYKIAG